MSKELSSCCARRCSSALLTTVLGAGAMFTLYTYISPVLNTLTHASSLFITAMLVLIGVGFSLGNYLGGKFADRSVSGTLKGFLLLYGDHAGDPAAGAIPGRGGHQHDCLGRSNLCGGSAAEMRVMRVAHEAPGSLLR